MAAPGSGRFGRLWAAPLRKKQLGRSGRRSACTHLSSVRNGADVSRLQNSADSRGESSFAASMSIDASLALLDEKHDVTFLALDYDRFISVKILHCHMLR